MGYVPVSYMHRSFVFSHSFRAYRCTQQPRLRPEDPLVLVDKWACRCHIPGYE